MSAVVNFFTSTFSGTLDAKGRVCIPAEYRSALTAQHTDGVYLRRNHLNSSLEGFGDLRMQQLLAAQAVQDPVFGTDTDDTVRLMLRMTQLLPRDENGRVRLPDSYIEHAGLKDRVTFAGEGASFYIWSTEAFEAMEDEDLKRARAAHAARRAARMGDGT
ncbi:MAG: hypothetical protein KGR48_06235 [Alphaproteobacteria bacterium]|nr:hypothetical protein [Alphaproteobacteria bacterium]MBU6474113.1 hypothetical protein [Alphaproteobacteria bacterium]MDE2012396.1 hypothetical protein [Alphaproteobacteria bacterium]MDE2073124.1 hypothetical protein [Alphaproteobacteria bacterium]MDE2353205.1 hypothetical protein [Alphaproteobacteria bacterium]